MSRDDDRTKTAGTIETFPPPPRRDVSSSKTLPPPVKDSAVKTSAIKTGTVIDDVYQILGMLGKGSMGTVYLAEDRTLNRRVAIKVLSSRYSRDKELVVRFRQEAIAMAKVRHENVVSIYAYGTYEHNPYFVMEHLEGETLGDMIDQRIERGELPHIDEAVGLMVQVCKGVEAIHKGGIVHRDLKPANILLGRDYRVAVADFGLVRPVVRSGDDSVDLDGTPMYLAPERIRSIKVDSSQTHLCDIYSLGAIFYELLTGLPPYEYDTVLQVLDAHIMEPPPSACAVRTDLPPVVDEVIARAMAKDPAQRFQTAAEMLEALWTLRTKASQTSGPHPQPGDKRTFVVADADPVILAALTRSLTYAYPEASVLTTLDGKTALHLIEESAPALAILDEDTPGLNALEVCSRLDDRPGYSKTVVVVTTKKADALRRKLFREMGAADLVEKAADPAALLEVISRALEPLSR